MLFSITGLQKELNTEANQLSFGKSPKELYDPIHYIMQLGGKRMRPLLTCLSYYIFEEEYKKIIPQSFLVEIFHNFSLMHDDIMDKAPLRRGKQTVHEKWNTNIAILSGDVMLVKAYEIMEQIPAAQQANVLKQFNQTATGVCEGQQLDMNFETRDTVSVEEYIDMIRLKTAVLLGFSMQLGGILANTTDKNLDLLYKCGTYAGIAFQLTDDLLDVYGNADAFGKQVGGDIVSNKKTYLLIRALEKATGKTKKELESILHNTQLSAEEKVKKVTSIYNQLDIKTETEEKIQYYFSQAENALTSVKGSIYRKHYIKDYFQSLIQRQN
jgi:geranylgeranyl diphosphate synthase type II